MPGLVILHVTVVRMVGPVAAGGERGELRVSIHAL